VRVRDVLGQKPGHVITVAPGARVKEIVRLLMTHNVGGLPVVDADGATVGFVAERDIVRIVHENADAIHHLPASAIMREVPICDADDSLETVMRRMTRDRLRHLVVRDNGRLVGVISVGDIVKQRLEQLETETGVLRDYVAAQRAGR
jgi:CBS domain-containing protein